jgi:hypothetical protein
VEWSCSEIAGTNFDLRAKASPACRRCALLYIFFGRRVRPTRKMHQVLSSATAHDHLQDVFSRIFCFVDQTVPSLDFHGRGHLQQGDSQERNKCQSLATQRQATIPSFPPKETEGEGEITDRSRIMTEKKIERTMVSNRGISLLSAFSRNSVQAQTGTTESSNDGDEYHDGARRGRAERRLSIGRCTGISTRWKQENSC